MSRVFQRQLVLPLMLLIGAGATVILHAQGVPTPAPASPAATSTNLPVVHSPLVLFTNLLAMNAAQQAQRLASWPAQKRARLLAKIREYDAMSPAARKESLGATELHWYLQQFLLNSPTNRTIQLSQVPAPYQQMVSDRLTLWKMLPPPLQQDVLAHDTTREFFLMGSRTTISNVPPQIVPPPLQAELIRLDALQPEQRWQTYAHFQNFFELTADEKQAVLNTLPESERQPFKKTLASLERLPREQRVAALRSLSQLAGLTAAQRSELFDKMSRWKQLSPEEQELWQKLDVHLPPLPPLPPPLPPRFPPLPGMSLATNPSR
jgi:hypothetical protein